MKFRQGSLGSFGCLVLCVLLRSPASSETSPILPGYDRFESGAADVAAGELLLKALRCTSCHAPPERWKERLAAPPGPRLEGVGLRLRHEYVAQFVRDPHDSKPGSTMPNMLAALGGAERERRGDLLDHFLASLREGGRSHELIPVSSLNGERLFHEIGCVACHEPNEDAVKRRLPKGVVAPARIHRSVPLGDLQAKYRFTSGLANFLLDPHERRPGGGMPRFLLSPEEAGAIAGYLRGPDAPAASLDTGFRIDEAKIQAGEEVFVSSGCSSCHRLDDVPALARTPLAGLDPAADGCLSESPPAGSAAYSLSAVQRRDLTAFLRALPNLEAHTPQSALEAELRSLNCFACHRRDDTGGPEPAREIHFVSRSEQDLGFEGRLPPPLDAAGAKLRTGVLEHVLRGKEPLRPYLATRMPDFGADAAARVAELLRVADRQVVEVPRERVGRNALGRKLVGTDGYSCIVCHSLNGSPSLGIPGIDLGRLPARLQPEWFRAFLDDPFAFRPGTRMPEFWSRETDENDDQPEKEELSSSRRRATAGRVSERVFREMDSIWVYLMESAHTRLPVGLEPADSFELRPVAPMIQRTFLEGAGMHAIAVGYPEGVHFAFDAHRVGLALLWRGRFLDAESTWEDRFTPPAVPLGTDVLTLPGTLFARLDAPRAAWPTEDVPEKYAFRGYRLDADGRPEFRYTFDGVEISERVAAEPAPKGERASVERTLRFRGAFPLWFRADILNANVTVLEPQDGAVVRVGDEIRVRVDARRDGAELDAVDAVVRVRVEW